MSPKRPVPVLVSVKCRCGATGTLTNPSKFWLAWHARNGWHCRGCKFALAGKKWRGKGGAK